MMKGMTGVNSFLFIVVSFLVVINHGFLSVHSTSDDGEDDSMTFEMIHRTSPKWRGNDNQTGPPKNQKELIKESHIRDMRRLQQHIVYPLRKGDGIEMPMNSASYKDLAEYVVEVKVGTPPRPFSLIVDTGSDLTWVKCRYKCKGDHCRREKKRYLLGEKRMLHHKDKKVFRADRSSTFKPVTCSSKTCKVLQNTMTVCPTPTSHCMYNISYIGDNIALGFYGEEIIRAALTTTHKKLKMRHMMIGCTETQVNELKAGDGILGLGFSHGSFADKTSRTFGPKFSYCLMNITSHPNVTSYLTFGPNKKAKLLGDMTHTKFVVNDAGHYGVVVSGISVDGKMLDIPSHTWETDKVSGGGTTLDSGTTTTWLAEPAYEAVMDAYDVKSFSKHEPIDIEELPYEMCVKNKGFNLSSVPKLAFHFADGAVFAPPVENYVLYMPPDDAWCLGFVKSNTYVGSVIGNLVQQNHLWEFDLEQQTISFAPSSCT